MAASFALQTMRYGPKNARSFDQIELFTDRKAAFVFIFLELTICVY
jgi:hypothetical protein